MRVTNDIFYSQALRGINSQREKLVDLNGQLSTGLRVEKPSDDPAAFAASQRLQSQNKALDQYTNNNAQLKNQLGLASQTVDEMLTVVSNVRSIALQANSGTINDGDREALSKQVDQAKSQLLGLANTSVAGGAHLFAGSRGNSAPFVKQSNGDVVYRGDDASGRTHTSTNTQVESLLSGSKFDSVAQGNGFAAVSADDGNTGGAQAVLSGARDRQQATDFRNSDSSYRIEFTNNADGQLTYSVTRDGANVSSGRFNDGISLDLAGSSVRIDGTPAAGDSFNVDPSRPQSMFETLDQLSETLRSPQNTEAQNAKQGQKVQTILSNLDNTQTNMLSLQATIGVSTSAIADANDNNATQQTSNKQAISQARDANTPEVIVKLQQSQSALSSALNAFSQVSDLSLFQYLR